MVASIATLAGSSISAKNAASASRLFVLLSLPLNLPARIHLSEEGILLVSIKPHVLHRPSLPPIGARLVPSPMVFSLGGHGLSLHQNPDKIEDPETEGNPGDA